VAPRLKVFVMSDGLTDYAVATSSKAKALAAWGVRQDVFKEGLAQQTLDPALVAAAVAQPGEVLRRPANSRGELAKLSRAKPPSRPKEPSQAALKRIAELQARLEALDAAHAQTMARLAGERAELDRRTQAEAADHGHRREKLTAALSAAQRAPG
jgi:vacuolar-type H+-ATPase subunit I/STV1